MNTKRTLTDFYFLRIALIGVATLLSVSIASAEALSEIDVAAAAAQIQDKQIKVLTHVEHLNLLVLNLCSRGRDINFGQHVDGRDRARK